MRRINGAGCQIRTDILRNRAAFYRGEQTSTGLSWAPTEPVAWPGKGCSIFPLPDPRIRGDRIKLTRHVFVFNDHQDIVLIAYYTTE